MRGSRLLLLYGCVAFCFGIGAAAQYSSTNRMVYLIVAIMFFITVALDVFVIVSLWRKGK